MREQQDRLFGMVDAIVGEVGLIVEDERDAVAAGDVRRRDDGDRAPVDLGTVLDAADPAARRRAPDRHAMQHPRQRHVIDVVRLAGDLLRSVATGR